MGQWKTIESIEKRKKFLKGRFHGKYRGKQISDDPNSFTSYYGFDIYEGTIDITEIEQSPPRNAPKIPYDTFSFDNILIKHPIEGDTFFKLSWEGTVLSNIQLSHVMKDEGTTYGCIQGDIYFEVPYSVTVLTEEWEEDPILPPYSPTRTKKRSATSTRVSLKEIATQIGEGLAYLVLAVLGIAFLAATIQYIWPILVFGIAVYAIRGASLILWQIGSWFLKFFQVIFQIAIWMLIIGTAGSFLFSLDRAPTYVSQKDSREQTQTIVSGEDTLISHFRVWRDYSGNEYEGYLKALTSDVLAAKDYRERLDISIQDNADWNSLYSSILDENPGQLDYLIALFDSIKKENNLSEIQFAEMMVSCIQDIPYALLLPASCDQAALNPRLNNLTNYPCRGNINYGLYAPIEFIASLDGDCDTRVLLLYELFTHYAYDVVFLVSLQYQHAMLGINLPVNGKYLEEGGKRYFFWETTSWGFRPGECPSEVQNLNYWSILNPTQKTEFL